jgi:hypothetical protein
LKETARCKDYIIIRYDINEGQVMHREKHRPIKSMKNKINKSRRLLFVSLALAGVAGLSGARADEVSDWNQNTFTAVFTANTSPLFTIRVTALVQSAVFDAVNGVYNRYTPVHVPPAAPNGASARAAVIQAAYVSLVNLYPTQKVTLDAQRAVSLAALSDGDGTWGQSVERGLAWGQFVADEIWAWRAGDGITPNPPPSRGGTNIGQWRPTPPGFLAGAGPQFAYMTTWVIPSREPFRPPGPPSLGTAPYAADVNESQLMGRADSVVRTADQTLFSIFWNGNTAGFWNRTALQMAERYDLSLLEKARLLALVNLAQADAGLCCWEAKYTYVFWRPITAIQNADLDPNPATLGDPTWTPLLITPNHPEYPSGHSTVSGAASAVLAAFFGDNNDFSVTSELTPGVTRYYSSFSGAELEVRDARVFGGIHFRTACSDGRATGRQVAAYVLANALQRLHGNAP